MPQWWPRQHKRASDSEKQHRTAKSILAVSAIVQVLEGCNNCRLRHRLRHGFVKHLPAAAECHINLYKRIGGVGLCLRKLNVEFVVLIAAFGREVYGTFAFLS